MKKLLQIVAVLALLGTIGPSIAVFYGIYDLQTCKTIMLISTVLWFLSGPKLMNPAINKEE